MPLRLTGIISDPMPNTTLVDDWIRVHRELMAKESQFTDLAIRAAHGEIPVEQLDEARAVLLGLRELCNAVYIKAFPNAKGDRQP